MKNSKDLIEIDAVNHEDQRLRSTTIERTLTVYNKTQSSSSKTSIETINIYQMNPLTRESQRKNNSY